MTDQTENRPDLPATPERIPATMRDTLDIRPLSKLASRVLVTLALLAATALAVLAASLMGDLRADPDVQSRVEALDEIRRQGLSPDAVPLDSLEKNARARRDSTRTGDPDGGA